MKHLVILAAVGAAILAVPGSAAARSDCPTGAATVGPVTVIGPGSGVTNDSIVGICVDTNNPSFDGGYFEVGAGDPDDLPGPGGDAPGVYAIIDGSDANPPGQSVGYAGISTYDSGGEDSCDGNIWNAPSGGPIEDTTDEGSGHNGGGCGTVRGVVSVPGLPFACGNTSGPDWADAGRDGCTIP